MFIIITSVAGLQSVLIAKNNICLHYKNTRPRPTGFAGKLSEFESFAVEAVLVVLLDDGTTDVEATAAVQALVDFAVAGGTKTASVP